MEREITFQQSLERHLNMFQPNKEHLELLVQKLQKSITPSVKKNKIFFQENAGRSYILSGGFKEYMMPVLEDYGILENHILGNTFILMK